MSKTTKQELGKNGERLAVQYLKKAGYQILYQNFRFGRSELDIISKNDETIIISEVKSFYAQPLGATAEFRVDKAKQKNIIKGAYGFLSHFPEYNDKPVRFDVIIVDFSSFPVKITWHKEAFWDEQGWGDF